MEENFVINRSARLELGVFNNKWAQIFFSVDMDREEPEVLFNIKGHNDFDTYYEQKICPDELRALSKMFMEACKKIEKARGEQK